MIFTAFVTARRGELVRAAVLMGADHAEAEDHVQTALMKCYRSWASVTAASDPSAYVYRVLINTMRSARRPRSSTEVPVEDPVALAGADQVSEHDADTGLAVRAALRTLSVEHQEVLVLRYFLDLGEEQSAEVLGLPRGTVKSRTSRAVAALMKSPYLAPEARNA